jgi:hypothetical protein
MSRELADYAVLDQLLRFYEKDLEAVSHNEVTGADLAGARTPAACAAFLSAALRRPQAALVWGEDIAFSHLEIWTHYITHSKKRFAIFAKSLKGKSQNDLKLGSTPVFTSGNGLSLPQLACSLPTLSTLLYVTDKTGNFSYVRSLPDRIHVFANHGDSDKHSNMSRLACAYDFVLVADSHAAQRFIQNGIQLPLERFIAMGGAVVDGAEPATTFGPVRRVLYAPTWEGYAESVNFSSLLSVAPILSRWPDAASQVRFRPHPATGNRRSDCSAAKAELAALCPARPMKAKAKDFNWSDAIIADVSGVLSEYLYTRKPIIVPLARSSEWLSAYIAGTPLCEYVYLWNYEEVTLDAILEEATRDPLRNARVARRERLYYNASSTDDSRQLFEQALKYFEMTRRLRSMTNPRLAARSGPELLKPFERTPEDPALAAVVRSIRKGELVLTA